jgi:hypothetical protein
MLASFSSAFGQQCLHGAGETPEEVARRRAAVAAARTVNTIEASQGASGQFVLQKDLADTPYAISIQQSNKDASNRLSLDPNEDIVPGWKLTLQLVENGYWFAIKDTTDPCGFALISNHAGVIFKAEPLR